MANDHDYGRDEESPDLGDQLVLIEALFSIAHESQEAEMVRLAVSALVNTAVGMTYLSAHPFTV